MPCLGQMPANLIIDHLVSPVQSRAIKRHHLGQTDYYGDDNHKNQPKSNATERLAGGTASGNGITHNAQKLLPSFFHVTYASRRSLTIQSDKHLSYDR